MRSMLSAWHSRCWSSPLAQSQKACLGVYLALAFAMLLGTADLAHAQYFPDPNAPGGYGDPAYAGGGGGGGGGAFQTQLNGDYWIGANAADRGLGYEGSYMSAGSVFPMFDDALWGTWVLDGRGHVSENGEFFGNFGVMRRQFIRKVMFGAGVFYDYDGDQGETFGREYHQIGVSGEIIGENAEWRINGYIPLGPDNQVIGTLDSSYYQNNIVLQQGIDGALGGVDSTFGFAVPGLTPWNTVARFGGYHYEADNIPGIDGFMAQLDITPADSIDVLMQVNHDDRFETTGSVSLVYHFGGSPRKSISQAIDRPTRRNDHIVRVHQEPIFALNPDNANERWRVIHVDNTAPAGGDGTYENPVNTLAAADAAASANHDIILVREGNGTTSGYNTGITLNDFQHLYGDGIAYIIPTQFGAYQLETDVDGQIPLITNPLGPAVLLANNNEVAGLNITAAAVGISGTGITNAFIHDTVVGNSVGNGIQLTNVQGTIDLTDNRLLRNSIGAGAGVSMSSGAGGATLNMLNNTVTENGTGVQLYASGTALTANLTGNNISDSRGSGIILEGVNGADVDFNLVSNSINRNGLTTNVGTGLRMFMTDSNFTALLDSNNILDNSGDDGIPQGGSILVTSTAGIYGEFGGTGSSDITITNNTISGLNSPSGNFGFLTNLNYFYSTNTVNTLLVDGNTITESTSVGVILTAGDQTALDSQITDNVITNNYHNAIQMFTFDDAVVRSTIRGNNIRRNGDPSSGSLDRDEAVSFQTTDQSRMIVYLDQNFILDNRPTSGEMNGVSGVAQDTSSLFLQATNNRINDNGDHAVRLLVEDNADIVALVRGNQMTNNRASDDFELLAEIDTAAQAGARMYVELTNNIATGGFRLDNNSLLTTLFYENNANTGAVSTNGPGAVVQVPQGTIDPFTVGYQIFP